MIFSGGAISSTPLSGSPKATAADPAPDLSWHPTYPDRVYPQRSLDVHSQQFAVIPPLIIPNNIPAGWIPIFPPYIPPHPALSVMAQRTYTSTISPIVNPAPPTDMPTMPTFPAQMYHQTLPGSAYQFYASGTPFLGFDNRAKAVYPDQFPPRRLRLQSQTFEIGAVLNVPKTGGWRPRYPDQLLPARRPNLGVFSYVTSSVVILNTQSCLTWVDEAVLESYFDDEALITSGITSEAVVSSDLFEEDVC